VLHIAAYTGGLSVPSARFRVRQYIPTLRTLGVSVDERPAALGAYPPSVRAIRPLWAAASLALRVSDIAAGCDSDVTFLQREMISGHFTVERFTRAPRVFDVDDAIWMIRGGAAVRKLAASCELVICGNDYIAEFFQLLHRRVLVLPTAVDIERYTPPDGSLQSDRLVIGWCGTSSGLKFLYGIEDALAIALELLGDATLRIVCDRKPAFRRVPPHRVDFIKWSQTHEAEALQTMSIGLMPLEESEWCLGKCSYKMLLYMACGVPVIVTPWGMNRDVLSCGDVGFGARQMDDWVGAIEALGRDPERRRRMGHAGRATVEREFSVTGLAPRLADALREVAVA